MREVVEAGACLEHDQWPGFCAQCGAQHASMRIMKGRLLVWELLRIVIT